jgi:hypothetical protein
VIPGKNNNKEFDYRKLYNHIIDFVKERTGIILLPPMDKLELDLL